MTRGDVVLVDWQYSDRTGSKLRPAVVVQADSLNQLIDDTVLVAITRTVRGIPGTEVILDPAFETSSGLQARCVASCTNFMTIDAALIDQTIGLLSDAAMQEIAKSLRAALQL